MNFALDTTAQDLDISTGTLRFISGPEEIAQKLRIRLRFVRGEWFADENAGIPYFDSIFIKNPSFEAIQAIYRQAITTCPGIDSLIAFNLVFDGATRKLSVTFTAQLTSGEVLDFSDNFVLEVA